MDDAGEDNWMDSLSKEARELVEKISLRLHRVNLERVQRIHLGLDSEDMEFSAKTLASMIQDVADRCDEDEAFTLHAVARALSGLDDAHELILKQKRRGKFVDPATYEKRHFRQSRWLAWLAHLEHQGVKTEAAIAEIAAAERKSRAAVFAEIKAAEKWLESSRRLFPESRSFDNPRPGKPSKTDDD